MADIDTSVSIDNISVSSAVILEENKNNGSWICTSGSYGNRDISYPPRTSDIDDPSNGSDGIVFLPTDQTGNRSLVQQARVKRDSESSGSDDPVEELGSLPSFEETPCVPTGRRKAETEVLEQLMHKLDFNKPKHGMTKSAIGGGSDSNSKMGYSLALSSTDCNFKIQLKTSEHESNESISRSTANYVRGETLYERKDWRIEPAKEKPPQPVDYKDFEPYNERLKSLKKWPRIYPTRQAIANAGLFYKGVTVENGKRIIDKVYCYKCGGALKLFEDKDDPLVEHAKYWPECRITNWY